MVSEEVGINEALAGAGFEVVETDLGEYILQLAKEPPSHIIAPAVHKTREQIAALFREHHGKHGLTKLLTEVPDLVNEARQVLRDQFLQADVGITGANFLVAETGSVVTVTNEGNAELTTELPRVHIVTAGIEKLVPTLEHCTVMLRLLARSALGTEITQYTTFFNGPRREGDRDGPDEMHVVLIDNKRTDLLAGEFRDMLRCIRCAACINHCPVYGTIGGHPYGFVYQGRWARCSRGDAQPRRGSRPAERLHAQRPLRRGLPGRDTLAGPDAYLASPAIRIASRYAPQPPGIGFMGLAGAAPALVSIHHAHGCEIADLACRPSRPLQATAVRGRLVQGRTRSACAAGRNVHGGLAQAQGQ
jgi:L-lactate utilization protein LutC